MTNQPALILIEKLCGALEAEGINYCHWKSNNALDRSASGDNDLDVLVDRVDAARFTKILIEFGFKQVFASAEKQMIGVLDFYGYDEKSGRLIHIHAHYLLVIGHDMTKNYRLALETPFLESATQRELFSVPSPEFEFVVFVFRMNLKYSTWDVFLQSRRMMKLSERQEMEYLLARCNKDQVNKIVTDHLAHVGVDLFEKCVQALGANYPTRNRINTGIKLQSRLKAHIRRPIFSNVIMKIRNRAVFGLRRRMNKTLLKHRIAAGGLMIAIIGGDGSGKTTAVNELYSWLSKEFITMTKHMGKPQETLFTRLVRGLLKIGYLLRLYPHLNSNNLYDLDPETSNFKGKYPWMIRENLKARDRYLTYAKVKRFANNGGIVISDRFPISQIKLMDGPCCMQINNDAKMNWLTKFLVVTEEKFYRMIAKPELMIVLKVNPEIAVKRKIDEKPKDVFARSTEVWEIDWKDTQVKVVDASRSQREVLSSIKSLIWTEL